MYLARRAVGGGKGLFGSRMRGMQNFRMRQASSSRGSIDLAGTAAHVDASDTTVAPQSLDLTDAWDFAAGLIAKSVELEYCRQHGFGLYG